MEEFLVKELMNLISIPSVTGEEGNILAYLSSFFEEMNLSFIPQRVENHWYNLIVNHKDENSVLITSHVDTVPPVDSVPPIPERRANEIWGLGSCDNKAGVVIMMALIKRFVKHLERLPVTFAFLVDEEADAKGSQTLIEEFYFPWAVVIEPTSLKIAIAQAGSIELDLEVKGKMAHGSCPEEGENAVEKTIKLIEKIKNLPSLKVKSPFEGAAFNIERIWGGDGELRVPDRCELRVEIRLPLEVSIEKVADELLQILKKENVIYRFNDISAPFKIDEDSWIAKTLSKIAKEELKENRLFCIMKSWTDAFYLYQAGIIPVIFGPGELALCHTPNEHISIPELVKAYKILEGFLKVCLTEEIPPV